MKKTIKEDGVHVGVHESIIKKKNNIVKNVRPVTDQKVDIEESPVYQEVLRLYESYIERRHMKHTGERLFILKKLYECQGPVDIRTLHTMVCKEEGLISLATMYNNLSLLVDAKLVRKLDLVGGRLAFYEKTVGENPHGYVICDKCGSISVLDEPDVFAKQYELPRGFSVQDITFHIHGFCHKCQLEEDKKNRKLEKELKKTKL